MSHFKQLFPEIAILGPGLLGGSLALALKGNARVRLWGRREAAVQDAQKHQVAEVCTTDLTEAVEGADLVIFCTPVETMAEQAGKILPFLSAKAAATDVGSVKVGVVTELEAILGSDVFIGSHPMAGAEQSGLSAAKAELFQGAACIVTPTEKSPVTLVNKISEFWQMLGCNVFTISPVLHDRQIALISHLPHLLAGCLMNGVARQHSDALQLVGQGFRDSTRIASGPPEMWRSILMANRTCVLDSLEILKAQITIAEQLLQSEDEEGLRNFLATAKTNRDAIVRKVRFDAH